MNNNTPTLRDTFAAAAMQAIIAKYDDSTEDRAYARVSEMAYRMADAMLAERNKSNNSVEI